MERKWVYAAFVDIRGFGTWIYRASIPQEVKEPFINLYSKILNNYVMANPGIHCKYLGDGFLAIQEFPKEGRQIKALFEFLKRLRYAVRKIKALIESMPHAPEGVRIRITEGYAYKISMTDPYFRDRQVSEFIEYGINTAERLLQVNPEITCLVTEGVARKLDSYRSIFKMRKLGIPSCYPKGVNKEDLESLEILRF